MELSCMVAHTHVVLLNWRGIRREKDDLHVAVLASYILWMTPALFMNTTMKRDSLRRRVLNFERSLCMISPVIHAFFWSKYWTGRWLLLIPLKQRGFADFQTTTAFSRSIHKESHCQPHLVWFPTMAHFSLLSKPFTRQGFPKASNLPDIFRLVSVLSKNLLFYWTPLQILHRLSTFWCYVVPSIFWASHLRPWNHPPAKTSQSLMLVHTVLANQDRCSCVLQPRTTSIANHLSQHIRLSALLERSTKIVGSISFITLYDSSFILQN